MELIAGTEPVEGPTDYSELRIEAQTYEAGRAQLDALLPQGRRFTGVRVNRG